MWARRLRRQKFQANRDELGNLGLVHEEEIDLVAFLKTITDGYQK